MALGGVLRAALRAGDWARAAAQSRRQARALRSFSPEFGTGRGTSAEEFLRRRGVDVPNSVDDRFYSVVPPWAVSEGFSNRAPLRFPLGEEGLPVALSGRTARGNALYIDPDTGRRLAVNPDMLRPGYSDIVAPYEGFRALPNGPLNRSEGIDNSEWYRRFRSLPELPSSPWMGRGIPPQYTYDPGGRYGMNEEWFPDGYFPNQFFP